MEYATVRAPAKPTAAGPCPKRGAAAALEARSAPPVVGDVVASAGERLDPATRVPMETRFGRDFGHVRVHRDATATRSARAVGAKAYTLGRHVVFGNGRYAPRSPEGRRLLAHELMHVVQQEATPDASAAKDLGTPGSAAEREADGVAASAVAPPVHERVGPLIQRDLEDPGRLASVHQDVFVSAPGTAGGQLKTWSDPSATDKGTAADIMEQAKKFLRTRAKPPTYKPGTTEAALDADAVAAEKRIRDRFPQITVPVSDQQIQDAVSLLGPKKTSDTTFQRAWLANQLTKWTDVELYAIKESDSRFEAMLDALLGDAEVGDLVKAWIAYQSAFQEGEGETRQIFFHERVKAPERRPKLIHELTHFHAHAKYREWVGKTTNERFFNEGFTEWLARRVMSQAELTGRTEYQDLVDAIEKQVASRLPEDDVARAFFAGEVWRVETKSDIARREFAAASGIHEGATEKEEAAESQKAPGLNQEVKAGAHYRFLNLGHDRSKPKPEHVTHFGTLKSRFIDQAPSLSARFVGHASTPGSLQYNDALSLQRAVAFYKMARDAGVPSKQLVDAAKPPHFGETKLTLTEEDAETRAFNRRVELFLVGGPDAAGAK